jgi:hypothetical protein
MIPTLGRTVHYVLPDTARHKGQHRAARISQVWTEKGQEPTEETPVALAVDLDPLNDEYGEIPILIVRNSTQDPYGKQMGSWHEPERAKIVEKPAAKAKERVLEPATA